MRLCPPLSNDTDPFPFKRDKGEREDGFTLIEMSVVLVIMGLVIMTVFPALQALRDENHRSATQTRLDALLRASAAYAQAHGCLPCPTPADAAVGGIGKVRGDTSASPSPCTPTGSVCKPEGIPPFVSIGLPLAMAKDGWGRWITMRVDNTLTAAALAIVPPSAPCTTTDVANGTCTAAQLGLRQKGLCKANLSATGAPITVRSIDAAPQRAALLFASHGRNGYGAYTTGNKRAIHPAFPLDPEGNLPTCALRPEVCNADDTDAIFSNGMPSPEPLLEYDDFLVYTDRNALISLLGQGGCEAAW